MDSNRYAIYILMGIAFLFQSIYLGTKKRKEKNFYQEPKLVNLLSTSAGTILLLYDFTGIWDLGTDRDTNVAIVLLGVMLLILIIVIFKSAWSGKEYTVHNIEKADLETILLQTLEKYELEYRIEKKSPHSLVSEVSLEQYDTSISMTQRGGSGTTFQLIFNKFDQIYYFEDVILDMKERINESTKAGKFRGINELILSVGIVVFAVWLGTLQK